VGKEYLNMGLCGLKGVIQKEPHHPATDALLSIRLYKLYQSIRNDPRQMELVSELEIRDKEIRDEKNERKRGRERERERERESERLRS